MVEGLLLVWTGLPGPLKEGGSLLVVLGGEHLIEEVLCPEHLGPQPPGLLIEGFQQRGGHQGSHVDSDFSSFAIDCFIINAPLHSDDG